MSHTATPQVGQAAPEVTLLDTRGARRALSELCAARPLVLLFYRGHW